MAKLHEVLAVEGSLKGTSEKVIKECQKVFGTKQTHFIGHIKTYTPLNADDTETIPEDRLELVTTVNDKLSYIQESIIDALDAMYQKESTNTLAKADIIIDDEIIETDVPAVVLLTLETRLKQIRECYDQALTYDPSKKWVKDDNEINIWKTDPVETIRTKKVAKPITLSPATKEHKAQVQLFTEDIKVGTWSTIYRTGCISPREKHEYLKRIDVLIRAVVKARQRANDQEVKNVVIGKKLFNYIHGV